ncbi:hypothetical protein CDAR_59641 [Caerostris darwini]|uniref:Uncharacterized protein n=1 Tax=Caerostris darwini TaxID=1538125 RepID=A0AAV4X5Q1_9ARAC|nr:hypothetical protein CDAR_59641 [Caerostris darwini]
MGGHSNEILSIVVNGKTPTGQVQITLSAYCGLGETTSLSQCLYKFSMCSGRRERVVGALRTGSVASERPALRNHTHIPLPGMADTNGGGVFLSATDKLAAMCPAC